MRRCIGTGAGMMIERAAAQTGHSMRVDIDGMLATDMGRRTLTFTRLTDGGSWDWLAVVRDRDTGQTVWSGLSKGLAYGESFDVAARAFHMLENHPARIGEDER